MTVMRHDWKSASLVGKKGMVAWRRYLQSRYIEYALVPDDYLLQVGCGDLVLGENADRLGLGARFGDTVEVKTEQRYTGNFAFERWANTSRKEEPPSNGWYYASGAKWLFYLFLDQQRAYCVRFDALRECININKYPIMPRREPEKNMPECRLVPVASVCIKSPAEIIGLGSYCFNLENVTLEDDSHAPDGVKPWEYLSQADTASKRTGG